MILLQIGFDTISLKLFYVLQYVILYDRVLKLAEKTQTISDIFSDILGKKHPFWAKKYAKISVDLWPNG